MARGLRSARGGGQHDIARFGSNRLFLYAPGDGVAAKGGTFTRSTTATYLDQSGTLQTAGVNTLRDGHYIGGVRSTLLEGASQNVFLQSGAPATQTITLTTGSWTLWVVGSGSIAIAAGTATLTGAGTATAGSPKTISVTVGGTVTCTVTGSLTRAQLEPLAFPSSYVPTTTAAVTRGADNDQNVFSAAPQVSTFYVQFVDMGTTAAGGRILQVGNSGGDALEFMLWATGGKYQAYHSNGTSTVLSTAAAAAAYGDTVELRGVLNTDGSVQLGQSINGGAEVVASASGAAALASAWTNQTLCIGSRNGAGNAFAAFQSVKIAAGVRSLAEMRNL